MVAAALHFEYTEARAFCKEIGLRFEEGWLPNVDREFVELELDQHQVDRLMRLHAWHLKYVITPSNFSTAQRLANAVRWKLNL